MENHSQINEAMNQDNAYSDNSATQLESSVMIHQTGLAMQWTNEEQTILENLFVTCSLEESTVSRYMRIAQELPNKTIRDVAMRCKWMFKGLMKSVEVENPNSDDHPQDVITDEHELIKQNDLMFDQISANLTSSSKLFENITFFNKSHENIMVLGNNLNENVPELKLNENVPEQMKLNEDVPEQMKLNEDVPEQMIWES